MRIKVIRVHHLLLLRTRLDHKLSPIRFGEISLLLLLFFNLASLVAVFYQADQLVDLLLAQAILVRPLYNIKAGHCFHLSCFLISLDVIGSLNLNVHRDVLAEIFTLFRESWRPLMRMILVVILAFSAVTRPFQEVRSNNLPFLLVILLIDGINIIGS